MTVAWPPPGATTVTQATRALVIFSPAARPEHLGTRRRRDLGWQSQSISRRVRYGR